MVIYNKEGSFLVKEKENYCFLWWDSSCPLCDICWRIFKMSRQKKTNVRMCLKFTMVPGPNNILLYYLTMRRSYPKGVPRWFFFFRDSFFEHRFSWLSSVVALKRVIFLPYYVVYICIRIYKSLLYENSHENWDEFIQDSWIEDNHHAMPHIWKIYRNKYYVNYCDVIYGLTFTRSHTK